MILPTTANFQQSPPDSFAHKSALFYEPDGRVVAGLDIGFKAVKLESVKRMLQNEQKTFMHQALARVRLKCVIAQRPVLKCTANDFIDVDDANNFFGHPMDD